MRSRRIYRNLLVLVTLVAALVGVGGYATDALRRADLGSIDARFDVRGDRDAPRDVVLVKIDEATLDEAPRFPLPRTSYADAIDRLAEAGARTIAVDVQFTEESGDPDADNALIEAVRAAGNVVLATAEIGEDGSTSIFGGGEGLRYSRATPAHILLPNDPGAIIRRMSLRERGLVSLPVAAAERQIGRRVEVPEGRGATPWIDFSGGPGRVASLSLADVVRGEFDRSAVRGRVVVIGATALALQDRQPTATTDDVDMPGPEILASAIDTVLRGFPLRNGPEWLDLALILLAAVTAPLASRRWGIVRAMITTAVVVVGIAGFAQLAFGAGVIVSVVYAGLAVLVAVPAVIVLHAMAVVFEREQVRATFARFVPESVVGEVLSCADGVRLGGVRRDCTLLFSDLRGFTSFSERREPSLVIDVLNRYLTEMSDAILDNGGTLVSYMGDGIMAVFGAPLDQPDHADRAVQAGVDMLARMEGFNAWMREHGHGDGFKMGVGLNTGPVMAGNVGSERRLEYTTIGDVTNTAARIEGMTKGTPHQLLLSDSTRLALQRPRELEAVGDVEIRGRVDHITLWTVPGTGVEPAAEQPVAAEPAG